MTSLQGTHYEFAPNKFEGRYWNVNGFGCAVVASIGAEGAWAAYIGGCPPEDEDEGLKFVASKGAKLPEQDARHFFPQLHDLPYRL